MADGAPIDLIKTTCPYCGVGCGIIASPTGTDSAVISGDPKHPANWGRLCSKGSALGETLGRKGRLLTPFVDGKRASWDDAMTRVAEGFARAVNDHGPDSVAFYLSGQLLTEDYYVANKLMKGFIGSANVDTNSRLCMASAVAGHKRAFGTDTVPGVYEDLERCDLLVLTGSNLAWCHPVVYQRIVAERERRPDLRIVVIDPRRTPTCDVADLHLALAPGTDVALYLGLFHHLSENGWADTCFVENHTRGIQDVASLASDYTVAEVSRTTQLSEKAITTFFDFFARRERVVTLFSMGTNQAADGSDRVNAIINVHLLTGRIGKEGMGPFSMTGQPNAMGGREVGGLANQLACHMDFEPTSIDRVQRFWNAPSVPHAPGRKAVDLFNAVADGQIKAIWIMATNPVASMPDADRIKAALKACPLVVVSDIVPNGDTVRCADVLLPATAWGEKDGTVTNSERRISRQRRFLSPPGLARADWWAVCELARRLGHGDAFDFATPADIFREYAAMTAFENNGTRDLDLGALDDLSDMDYARMDPVQWPCPKDGRRKKRFFADGQFYTEDRRARFVPPRLVSPKSQNHLLTLNTGRIRDQWHTMTRTGRAPRLNRHAPEPYVDVHPDDAQRSGLIKDGLAHITNERGSITVRTNVTSAQREGSVFVPMHWTDDTASNARVDVLVSPDVDPVSGQPALKASTVSVEAFRPAWYGFAVGSAASEPDAAYWARAVSDRGVRFELAGSERPSEWRSFAVKLLGMPRDARLIEEVDEKGYSYRCAVFMRGRVWGAFIAGSEPIVVARDWLADQIGRVVLATDRHLILRGQPPDGYLDPGPTVCACLDVGRNTICAAIKNGAHSLNAVGDATGAGTGCGSCRAEIRKLMEVTRVPEKA
ncbi:MAG: molybdopterin-dependent oxidoreductase [Pseudomonadota bacterium]